jgi:hypothetical protein
MNNVKTANEIGRIVPCWSRAAVKRRESYEPNCTLPISIIRFSYLTLCCRECSMALKPTSLMSGWMPSRRSTCGNEPS